MSKFFHNRVLDNGPNEVINNADQAIMCEGEPADYTEATTAPGDGGCKLADTNIGSGDFDGPVDGDSGGRVITFLQQDGVDVDNDGKMDHIAFVDDDQSDLLAVNTSTEKNLVAGDTEPILSFDMKWRDPV